MSDKACIVAVDTRPERSADSVEIFMDGESGTWQLFINPKGQYGGSVDFSLAALKEFSVVLYWGMLL